MPKRGACSIVHNGPARCRDENGCTLVMVRIAPKGMGSDREGKKREGLENHAPPTILAASCKCDGSRAA